MADKNDLLKFGMIPLASIAGGFLVALILAVFVVHSGSQNDHQNAILNLQADSIQQQLNLKLNEIEYQHATIANSLNLAQIVASNSPSERATEESALLEMIPNAIRVRIFGLREAEVQRDAVPPFSFTSLDLVNRVEVGEKVFPEAINANGRWIVSIATPIKIPADDTVRGTLFVYLDMKSLVASIEENINGELKLLQAVGSANPTEILVTGIGAAPEAPVIDRELTNPNWHMQFAPSLALSDHQVSNLLLMLLPVILLAIAALVGVFIGISRFLSMLNADLSHLDHQISSVAANFYEPSSKYQIQGFLEVDQNLSRLGKKQESKAPVPKLDVKSVTPRPGADGDELVDIEMSDDESFEEAVEKYEDEEDANQESAENVLVPSIFRAYDIRGVVNETLTMETIQQIGLAIGSEAQAEGERTLLVGADGRISSPEVSEALIAGLLASGCDVVNIGQVPTPILYFATHNSDATSGVMVTGSHNPPEYNGFKIVIAGRTFVDEDVQRLYQRIVDQDFETGEGELSEININEDYIDAIADDVVVAQPLKVVVDCGNGIAGDIAPDMFAALGCEVVPLYCDVDGTFPNHPPDPTVPEHLEDLILTVKSQDADLGIALDGDGDRLVAVTRNGNIVWPDKLLMLFAKDVVSRNPGSDVVYDIKCTRHLNSVISGFGGRPVLCRTGHSFVKAKMTETGAVLGGEMSGHICFSERWFGFDDGIYSASRLLEIVGSQTEGLEELLQEFPVSVSTPEILIAVDDDSKFDLIEKMQSNASFDDGTVTTIDGIRVDFTDGWGLIRASNTNPMLTLRFEADNDAALERIKGIFRTLLQSVRDNLDFT